jgi:hypothetical protein
LPIIWVTGLNLNLTVKQMSNKLFQLIHPPPVWTPVSRDRSWRLHENGAARNNRRIIILPACLSVCQSVSLHSARRGTTTSGLHCKTCFLHLGNTLPQIHCNFFLKSISQEE